MTSAVAATQAVVSCGAASPDDRSPDANVIFISIDTLRADHLGCYGYPRTTSPRIDEFSRSAVLFQTATSQAPSTGPSHASMFTSRIPSHHGLRRAMRVPISPDVPILAEILHKAGYRTISYNDGGQVAAIFGFGRGFDAYESAMRRRTFSDKVDSAIDWLDHNPGQKFFFFLHTYEVHAPYRPDAAHLKLLDEGPSAPPPRIDRPIPDYPARRVQQTIRMYDGAIRSVDDAFGRLIDYLVAKDLLDRTIVIFTSDHGEALGEHGVVSKHSHSLYDEVLRVPLIWKPAVPRTTRPPVDRQVRSIDIMPTLLDVLGLDGPPDLEGISLVGLMRGGDTDPLVAISQMDTLDDRQPTSIRTEGRKLIMGYPLLDDPTLGFQWFRDSAEVTTRMPQLALPLASVDDGRMVEILVDGARNTTLRLSPLWQSYEITMRGDEPKTVTIRSPAPCKDAAGAAAPGADPGACVSFRIFNPFEFYQLSSDPQELDNRYLDQSEAVAIADLRALMQMRLAAGQAPGEGREPVKLDEATRRRLRSLGYVP